MMAKPEGHKDPDYLSRAIERYGVTTLHFVPSMLQSFLADGQAATRCGQVVRVMCSGEALPAALVAGLPPAAAGGVATCMGRRRRRWT
ncbi:hypothetical protein M8494_29015 [Serratia ureilytica]